MEHLAQSSSPRGAGQLGSLYANLKAALEGRVGGRADYGDRRE